MKRIVQWMLLLILAFGNAGAGRAEIIPPYGEGQIGLQAVVLCETLTVRQQPGASSRAVRTLHYGDRIIVQPETGGWAACFLSDDVDGGRAGWVDENYLAIDPAWYRTEEKTPVYAWNDTSAPRVALLDENTTLPILKTEGNWLVVSLRGAAGWIWRQDSAAEKTERQDGERFAATILLEGMAETIWYEHAVNDAMGIARDFDYESLVRHSEPDCEYFISRYDDAENPLNYLELRYYAADAETVAAAIGEELSKTYDITREAAILEGAGSCICVDASAEKGRNTMPYLLQTVYIVPTAGGCIAATAHCTIESAEGFGARFHAIMNTLTVTNSPA